MAEKRYMDTILREHAHLDPDVLDEAMRILERHPDADPITVIERVEAMHSEAGREQVLQQLLGLTLTEPREQHMNDDTDTDQDTGSQCSIQSLDRLSDQQDHEISASTDGEVDNEDDDDDCDIVISSHGIPRPVSSVQGIPRPLSSASHTPAAINDDEPQASTSAFVHYNPNSWCEEEDDMRIFDDVEAVAGNFPDFDRNRIYSRLEKHEDRESRVRSVIDELAMVSAWPPEVIPSGTLVVDPYEEDAAALQAEFPDIPPHEIYVILVDVADDPDSKGTARHILASRTQNNGHKESKQKTNLNDTEVIELEQAQTLQMLLENVQELEAIFPDADPNYLYQEVVQRLGDANRVVSISEIMSDSDFDYPTIQQTLESANMLAERRRLQELDMTSEEFLRLVPDAVDMYYKVTEKPSQIYQEHCTAYLGNLVPGYSKQQITKTLDTNKFHLTPSLRQLETTLKKNNQKTAEYDQICQRMPETADEEFYMELFFTRKETEIRDYQCQQEAERERRLQECREIRTLEECECCYDIEVLPDDVIQCGAQVHKFCKDCVGEAAKVKIGQGQGKLDCLAGNDCDSDFSLPTLQTLLTPKQFSALLNYLQTQELQEANMKDLIMCPFCPFATIVPDIEHIKLLQCLNPKCMKESCVHCKKLNHTPHPCEDVQSDIEKKKNFVDEKMTDALLRTCWKCQKKFYKEAGCNMMTCECGAKTCYVCRKQVADYNHFGAGRCPQDSNLAQLHQENIEAGVKEALAMYEEVRKRTRNNEAAQPKPPGQAKSKLCAIM